MKTFNVKIVLMLCLIIILLISVSTVYFMDLAKFDGNDQLFIPVIIALVTTLIKFHNNISEKDKIVNHLKQLREAGNDQEKIKFQTCPEYWTKTTHGDNVYCHNNFTDVDAKNVIIGDYTTVDNVAIAAAGGDTDGGDDACLKQFGKNICTMRSSAVYPETVGTAVETVEAFQETEDTASHKHSWTYYAHKDDIQWDDEDFGKQHADHKYNDDDHLINVAYWHNHDQKNGVHLTDSDGNKLDVDNLSRKRSGAYIPQEYSNDTNWISPYTVDGKSYAEINLTDLNKTKNKCDLVTTNLKDLSWVEAANKCGNINKKFDL